MYTTGISYESSVREFKRCYLLEVLARHKGNQSKAAEGLGMHRNTLSQPRRCQNETNSQAESSNEDSSFKAVSSKMPARVGLGLAQVRPDLIIPVASLPGLI